MNSDFFQFIFDHVKANAHWIYLSFVLAAIPAIALLVYIYRADRNRPEPKGKVLKVFFIGLLFVIPVCFVEHYLHIVGARLIPPGMMMHAYVAFVVAAGVEEFAKLLVVILVIYHHPVFDERMDGIVYAVAASLGFAFIENFIYIASSGMFAGVTSMLQIALLRGLLAVPGHAVNSVLTGYGLGKAKFESGIQKYKTIAVYLLAAIGIHGLYDFIIFSAQGSENPIVQFLTWLTVPLVVGMIFVSRKLIRRHVTADAIMITEGTDY